MDVRFVNDSDEIRWGELALLYNRAPLGRERDPEQLRIAFNNGLIKVFVFDGQHLIGAGRALSDGV